MAMNSFENRNFMEPMGMPKHAFKLPCFFFLLSFEGIFFFFFCHFSLVPNVFPLCSLQVPNEFTSGFQYDLKVPNGFTSGFQYDPQDPKVFLNMFLIAPHVYPICFGKSCPPFTYIGGPKGRIFVPLEFP